MTLDDLHLGMTRLERLYDIEITGASTIRWRNERWKTIEAELTASLIRRTARMEIL